LNYPNRVLSHFISPLPRIFDKYFEILKK